jgi:hypothetical protein
MNNWCICWFFTHIFTGNFNFKGRAVRRLYKSFGVKGLNLEPNKTHKGSLWKARQVLTATGDDNLLMV